MYQNNTETPNLYPGWTTVRKIGSGSFGAVYEIERRLFETTERAALKVINVPKDSAEIDELFSSGYDEEGVRRHCETLLQNIVREYEIMVGMKGNSNVVSCEDIQCYPKQDSIGWTICIKMELLTPMMKVLDRVETEDQIIKFGEDMCKALVLCHGQNIIHRDIKPQNIFLARDGSFKLGDFGIAKVADQVNRGTRIGTVSYMAPEVYTDLPYGHAADIYSLGVVLYWLLNEKRLPLVELPPAVPTTMDVQNACLARLHGYTLPAPAHASPALSRIVLKACAYNPAERYASAQEMLWELQALQAAGPAAYASGQSRSAGQTTVLSEQALYQTALAQEYVQPSTPQAYVQPAAPQQYVQPAAPAGSMAAAQDVRGPASPAKRGKKKRGLRIFAAVLAGILILAIGIPLLSGGGGTSDVPDLSRNHTEAPAHEQPVETKSPASTARPDGWSVIGWICGTQWDKDFPMYEVGSGIFVSDVLTLQEGDKLKVRKGGSWQTNFGSDGLKDGPNCSVPKTGSYQVYLTLTEDDHGYILLARQSPAADDFVFANPAYLIMSPGETREIDVSLLSSVPDSTLWFHPEDDVISAAWVDWGGADHGPLQIHAEREGYTVLSVFLTDSSENKLDEILIGVCVQ